MGKGVPTRYCLDDMLTKQREFYYVKVSSYAAMKETNEDGYVQNIISCVIFHSESSGDGEVQYEDS